MFHSYHRISIALLVSIRVTLDESLYQTYSYCI